MQNLELTFVSGKPKLPIGWKPITAEDRAQCLALIDWCGEALSLTPAVPVEDLTTRAAEAGDIFDADDRSACEVLYRQLCEALKMSEGCFEEITKIWNERHKRATTAKAAFLAPLEVAKKRIGGIIHKDHLAQKQAAEEERQRLQDIADAKARAEQIERQRKAAEEQAKQDQIARENREKQRLLNEAQAKAKTKAAIEQAARDKEAFERQKQIDADQRRAAQLAVQEAESTPIIAPLIERKEVAKPSGVRVVKPVYRVRSIDIEKLPRRYCLANEKAIDAAVKSLGEKHGIDGVIVYLDEGAVTAKG